MVGQSRANPLLIGRIGGTMEGGPLTNIRVAGRDGRDELHVQLSSELRKAQNIHQTMQHKMDLLVAKEEDHLSKISGLEAAHGRLRKTLRTTESNLETHALESRQRIESLQTMVSVSKIEKNLKIENVVKCVTILDCNYRKNYFSSFIPLLMCSLESQLQNKPKQYY